MKKLLILLSICLASATVSADTKPSDSSVEELLTLSEAYKLVDNMLPQMEAMIKSSAQQSLEGKTPDDEQREVIETVLVKTNALVKQEVSYEKMKPIFIKTYKDTFTQTEINGLLEFYKSKTGQAFLKKMPSINQAAAVDMQIKLTNLLPKIQQISEDTLSEVRARRKTTID